MAQPTDSDDDFSELERERKRELRSNYVKSGIHVSSKHKRWQKGRHDAEAAANAQEAEMAARQQIPDPSSGAGETAVDPPQVWHACR
jgi:hypothetical protein